ncbi:MAG TPA: hypothetical protein VJ725_27225 [Thermoanaerobaculia bacterium]|nr:hypothetical protein [Thermoanaerobaculia bacterium]
MITERAFYLIGRVPEWVIWAIFTLSMTAAVRYVVPGWGWLSVAYFPLLLFIASLSNSEKATGFFVARRGTLAASCVVLSILIALSLIRWYPSGNSKSIVAGSSAGTPVVPYLLMGAVLGALLRNVISLLIGLALLGKKRLGQNVLATALWSVGIALFPWEGHRNAAAWYIGGMGLGVILSRSFRLRVVKAAEAFWRIQEISESFPKGANISEVERESLNLLAKGRELPLLQYRKLRARLEEWRGSNEFSTRVALISASVYRQGREAGSEDWHQPESSSSRITPSKVLDGTKSLTPMTRRNAPAPSSCSSNRHLRVERSVNPEMTP